ncbi:MAG: FAD-dependent thymidylate synthase, partial [Chloroflexota bacterium]
SDRAHRAAIRAKAADVLRAFLPAGHLTNVGLLGNGRALEYLLIKMAASPLAEVKQLGRQLSRELALVIPAFTRRAGTQRGRDHSAYLAAAAAVGAGGWGPAAWDKGSEGRGREAGDVQSGSPRPLIPDPQPQAPATDTAPTAVTVVDADPEAEEKVIAAILYAHAAAPLEGLRQAARAMPAGEREAILRAYVEGRQSRHQRPGRAFEMAAYTVEFCANFGVYKDLQRHRLCTQRRQRLSTDLGYTTPPELARPAYESRFHRCMELAAEAYEALVTEVPAAAQYVVPMAYRLRWIMHLNLRELGHMVELRSTVQGHPDYRAAVHDLTRQVRRIHPLLATLATQFVDWTDVDLARLDSERRQDQKATARTVEAADLN